MSDKCQVYELNGEPSLKRGARRVEKCPSLPLFFVPSSSSSSSYFTPPCFLVNPPLPSCRCFPPLFLHAVCPFLPRYSSPLGLASAWISSLIVLVSCSCWCFLLYFHLALFCRAYRGLLTAPAVRYLSTVYLWETFSHHCSAHTANRLVWPGPWILLTLRAVCFEFFEGIP